MSESVVKKASEQDERNIGEQVAGAGPGTAISVVIPAYNCASCLPRAIESALDQTYPPIECIVVNDGSTDDTAGVAASYGDRVIVADQENQGASAARNAGIDRATGDYIAFLDADDYWHPSKLEKQAMLVRDHPEVVLVCTGLSRHYVSDGATRIVPLADEPFAPSEPYQPGSFEIYSNLLTLFRDPYLGTPSVMVRTDRAREVGGFDTGLTIAEDIDFFFRVCQGHPYARIHQALTVIHQRAGSLTKTEPGYQMNLEVLDRFARANPAFVRAHASEFDRQRLSIYENWVAECLVAGYGGEARALLRESRQYGRIPPYGRLLVKSYLVPFRAPIKRFFAR